MDTPPHESPAFTVSWGMQRSYRHTPRSGGASSVSQIKNLRNRADWGGGKIFAERGRRLTTPLCEKGSWSSGGDVSPRGGFGSEK